MKNLKMWKRLVALAAASAMVIGCFTACGNDKPVTSSESTPASESVAASEIPSEEVPVEPAELTYWGPLDSNANSVITNMSELGYIQEMMEAANVDIEFFHPASGTEKEQFNLKVVGREFEDIIEYTWGNYPGGGSQAIADGVIINIADYLEYCPNFAKYLEENPSVAKQIYTANGEIYAFPAIGSQTTSVTGGYIIRQDMLDELGMEVPVTISDWEKVLTAAKDKFGLTKTLTLQKANLIANTSYFAGAWGTFAEYYVDNGVVKYGPVEADFKEYVATMADWWKKGLIDIDSFGNNAAATRSNLLNNDSFATYGNIGATIGTVMNSAKETNPNLVLVGTQYPVLEEGQEPTFVARTWDVRTQGMAAVSTSCKDIEAALRFLDLFYTEEGKIWKNFGVEGESYTMVNGYPTYTDLILNNPDGLAMSEALGKYTRASSPSVGFIDSRYHEQYYQIQEQVDAMFTWNEYADNAIDCLYPNAPATAEEAEELAGITSQLKTYVEENLTKFIMGVRSMDEYDKFVEELKSLKVERAIEIKQAAYDRYMAN